MPSALRASPLFTSLVLVALALFGFFGAVLVWPEVVLGWLGQSTAGHVAQHFRLPNHRVHDLTFAYLLGTAAVGLLAQLRAPSRNAAGQVMALVPFVALALVAALTNASVVQLPWVAIGAATLAAASLHPTGRQLVGSFRASRVSRSMLALVVAATVPLLVFAAANLELQRIVPDEHAVLGHYGFMAAFAMTIVAVAVIASLRPNGWWLAAWVAGGLPALLGITSLLFPEGESGLGAPWAVAAVAWGGAFLVAGRAARRGLADPTPSPAPSPRADRSIAAYLPGAVAGGLALLFVVMHLVGGGLGPGLHSGSGGEVAQDVPIVMGEFGFTPTRVVVHVGQPVRVTVLNTGKTPHDWTAQAIPGIGHLHALPGQSASAIFTPTQVGSFKVICAEPGHEQAGMVGELVVEP